MQSFLGLNSDRSSSRTAAGGAKVERPLPWVEKFRPKKVDDIAHQDEVRHTLRKAIQTGNLPHLLFYGPPGTGKTTTILAVARELFGNELMKTRVLELNASDERGIKVVRERVKQFAQHQVSSEKGIPPFKIVILDEADSMTGDAQAALRRTMETYSKITRFCLICNYVTRIIEPLASRCAKFRFKALDKSSMLQRLQYISREENIDLEDEALSTILDVSEGDMRKAINFLQSCSQVCGEKGLQPDTIVDIAGVIPEPRIAQFWTAAKSRSFSKLRIDVNNLVLSGYSAMTLLRQIEESLVSDVSLNSVQKARICMAIAEADKKISDGADEELQMLDVGQVIFNQLAVC